MAERMRQFKTIAPNIYRENNRIVARGTIEQEHFQKWFKEKDHDDPIKSAMEYVEWMRNKPIYHPLGTCPVADQFIRMRLSSQPEQTIT